jgi:hypothetical protein
MKTPEQKAVDLVRTIGRMDRYNFMDLSDDQLEDALATVNALVSQAREIVAGVDHAPSLTDGGGHVNNGKSCAICKGEWEDDAPPNHAATCALSAPPSVGEPPAPFPDAEIPITLTGSQWTAVLARIVRRSLSDKGQRLYREAATRLQTQLLAASDRHASTGTAMETQLIEDAEAEVDGSPE